MVTIFGADFVGRRMLAAGVFLTVAFPFGALHAGIAEDAASFRNGQRRVWTSDGVAKAEGVKFGIAYPASWKVSEDPNPAIVRQFGTQYGEIQFVAQVVVKSLPADYQLTPERIEKALSEEQMKLRVPAADAKFISYRKTRIQGQDCAIMECQVLTGIGGKLVARDLMMRMLFWKGRAVCLSFEAAGEDDGQGSLSLTELHASYESAKPLFAAMAETLIFDPADAAGSAGH